MILSISLMPILFFLTIKFDANLIFKKVTSILIASLMIVGANYLFNNMLNISDYFELLYFDDFSENGTFSDSEITSGISTHRPTPP